MLEDPSAPFLVLFHRIDPFSIANPDFPRLANAQFGMLPDKLPLAGQFRREPFVVRIEQGDPFAPRRRDAPVAGRADTGAILPDQAKSFPGKG